MAEIEATGRGIGWQDGDPGYEPTYVFTDPDEHEFGLYHESEWYTPPDGLRPSLKNQARACRLTRDGTQTPGRLHHIAFAVDSRDGILRPAEDHRGLPHPRHPAGRVTASSS